MDSMDGSGEIKRYRRFGGCDYSKGASLFITIALERRRPVFGRIAGGAVVLSPLGVKVKEALEAIPSLNPGIALFGHVVMPDHVHLLLDCKPQFRISDMVKILKGNTARWLFMKRPELKKSLWGGHLWNPSYCAVTVSDRSREQVTRYIESQKEKG